MHHETFKHVFGDVPAILGLMLSVMVHMFFSPEFNVTRGYSEKYPAQLQLSSNEL